MKLRKFALLVLVCSLFYGFSVTSVPASANNDASVPQTATEDTANNPDAQENTTEDEPEVLPEIAPSATPAATAKPEQKKKHNNTKKKNKPKYTKAQLRLMASIINCEAGAECYQGKLAVGIVVMNRVRSNAFPDTVRGVIYQKFQFSPVRNGALKKKLAQYDSGKIHSAQWKSCISAAKKALAGQKTIVVKGKVKNIKKIHFFSVVLPHAKFKLGGHRFK